MYCGSSFLVHLCLLGFLVRVIVISTVAVSSASVFAANLVGVQTILDTIVPMTVLIILIIS